MVQIFTSRESDECIEHYVPTNGFYFGHKTQDDEDQMHWLLLYDSRWNLCRNQTANDSREISRFIRSSVNQGDSFNEQRNSRKT